MGSIVILIGLGANLPSDRWGPPKETLSAALSALDEGDVRVLARSRWYRSAPFPASDQPWYINGVAVLETTLEPSPLLALLHDVERRFGRVRSERWAARAIDLDLLAYCDVVSAPAEAPASPILPHPELHSRAFVLLPLAEVAPEWRHPRLGGTAAELMAELPPGQRVEVLSEGAGAAPG